MDINLAATHEAGHAVMQWLMGLEVGELVMTVRGADASEVSTRRPRIPLPTLSDLRKRLLALLAGNAVTLPRWSSWNDTGDWRDMITALREYLKLERLGWVIIEGNSPLERFKNWNKPRKPEVENRNLDHDEANAILQDAIARCREIVTDPLFQKAIDEVAAAFIAAPVGENGVTRLEGSSVVEICERVVGKEFRATNRWSAWITDSK